MFVYEIGEAGFGKTKSSYVDKERLDARATLFWPTKYSHTARDYASSTSYEYSLIFMGAKLSCDDFRICTPNAFFVAM